MTAALLPVVVAERKRFGELVREGIRVTWEGKSRWWLPVVAQMVLLGWITFFSVSYSSNPRPDSFSTQNNTDFSVNAFWTGGYANECQWRTRLMAVSESPRVFASRRGLSGGSAMTSRMTLLSTRPCGAYRPSSRTADDSVSPPVSPNSRQTVTTIFPICTLDSR